MDQKIAPKSSELLYQLEQNKSRAIIPKIITLISLGIIFYLGILLNLSLLEMNAQSETITKIISLLFLLGIIGLGIYLAKKHSEERYYFYRDRINFIKESINYSLINNTNPQQDFLDKIFNTYNLNLGNHFIIKHIPKEIQIENYLKQMIAYSQRKI